MYITTDVTDSRDIIQRIAELEAQRDEYGTLNNLTNDESDELVALQNFTEVCDGETDEAWEYGVTVIHMDYFTEYAEQFADDLGLINRDATWPLNYIDWDAAADDLKQDYAEIDFQGETYYVR